MSGKINVFNDVLYLIILLNPITHLSVKLHLFKSNFSKFIPLNIHSAPISVNLLSLNINVFNVLFLSIPVPILSAPFRFIPHLANDKYDNGIFELSTCSI